MSPKLIFGTGNLGMAPGSFQDSNSVRPLMSTLKDLGVTHIDTAARYPPPSPGLSEKLVGESADGFVVDTKVITDTRTDGSGDLENKTMEKSVNESLRRLNRDKVRSTAFFIGRFDASKPETSQAVVVYPTSAKTSSSIY
jgi:aflatoxin B1 aldehyde reductase